MSNLSKGSRWWKGMVEKANFYRDLPDRSSTNQLLIAWILDGVARGSAQLGIPHDEPEERVSVEQQPHCV